MAKKIPKDLISAEDALCIFFDHITNEELMERLGYMCDRARETRRAFIMGAQIWNGEVMFRESEAKAEATAFNELVDAIGELWPMIQVAESVADNHRRRKKKPRNPRRPRSKR